MHLSLFDLQITQFGLAFPTFVFLFLGYSSVSPDSQPLNRASSAFALADCSVLPQVTNGVDGS